jgi:hypothetical protein
MICRSLLLIPTLCLCWTLDAAAADAKSKRKVYRWVDESGQVHYSNTVPPQYAEKDREVLNRQGVAVGKVEGDVTEAEARDQAETARRLKEAAQRRQRDNVLLQTYLSVQEIEMLRDRRVEILDGQIGVESQYITGLKQKLTKLMQQSANFAPRNKSPNARPLPENLRDDMARTGTDIRTSQANLTKKRAERQALIDQFAADIKRLKELKGIKDSPPAATGQVAAQPASTTAKPSTASTTAPSKPKANGAAPPAH